jgi:hypothetical protein
MDTNTQLQTELFALLKDETRDLLASADDEFLRKIAEDLTREKILSISSEKPEEHKQNIQHLLATLEGQMALSKIRLNRKGEDLFIRIVGIIIKTVALAII